MWSQSPPAATTGRAMSWWQGPTYHSLDKFGFIIYSHQPIECLIPRKESGQSRWKTIQPHTLFTGSRITSTSVILVCAHVDTHTHFHTKKPPVITNLVMNVIYVCLYTHIHLCVSVGKIKSIANIRIHSQCSSYLVPRSCELSVVKRIRK